MDRKCFQFDGAFSGVILWVAVLWGIFALAGCSGETEKIPPETVHPVADAIGEATVYLFSPDPDTLLGAAQPLALDPASGVEAALSVLGQHLAAHYFESPPERISFSVAEVIRIPGPGRRMRLGVVDMVDPDRIAERSFFQGSTGGKITFCMMAATFLQPTRNPPLLDGLILRYNGEEMPEHPHIRLQGILIPAQVAVPADRAIRLSRTRSGDR